MSVLQRTNADKRHAVLLLLKDEEWAQWSDREIARRCCIAHPLVGRIRAEMSLVSDTSEPTTKTYTNKHGQTATMNTENIGRKQSDPGMSVLQFPDQLHAVKVEFMCRAAGHDPHDPEARAAVDATARAWHPAPEYMAAIRGRVSAARQGR